MKRCSGLVCGIGISDDGKYQKWVNHKDTREYSMWLKMIARCYADYNRQPTYDGCTVSDEFLYFQTFAEFYNQNKWTDELLLIPDKDILTHGKSKVYSRDTILFVDKFINTIFTRRQNHRGNLPIGVSERKYPSGTVKYVPVCNEYGKCIYLGTYFTPQEAFVKYKEEKERYIKEVANNYKNKYPKFPEKLYKAMMEYEVLEDD
jgi:hypothetical protein